MAVPRRVIDAAISASSGTLTSSTALFTSADVGRTVRVAGAGTSGAALVTTIASVTNGTTAVLTATASTTVSGAVLDIGSHAEVSDELSAFVRGRFRLTGVPRTYTGYNRLLTIGPYENQADSAPANKGYQYASLVNVVGCTLSEISVHVSSVVAGISATATVTLSLYRLASDGLPGVRAHDWTFQTGGAAGLKTITGLSEVVEEGLYWVAWTAPTSNLQNMTLAGAKSATHVGTRAGLYDRAPGIQMQNGSATGSLADFTSVNMDSNGSAPTVGENVACPLLFRGV